MKRAPRYVRIARRHGWTFVRRHSDGVWYGFPPHAADYIPVPLSF